jgi:hypothetical protein
MGGMYKRINYTDLVEGQSYFLVPHDRLLSSGLATKSGGNVILPDFVSESKKKTILFPEGVLVKRTVVGPVEYNNLTLKFADLQSKGTPLKKSTADYVFHGYLDPPIAFFPTVPSTAVINATPNMNALVASMGKVRLAPEACGGAGCAAAAPLEVTVVTAAAPAIGRETPSSDATNDLFLWAINGNFGPNTLATILKRKNVNVNELLAADIFIKPADYDSKFRITIPGLDISSNKLFKTIVSNKFNKLCDLGPDFPADLFEVRCLQSVLDIVIMKYEDNVLAPLELLLATGADPNLGVITACHQRKPNALNMLIQAGAQPKTIVLKYMSTKGNFITHPLLAATPCFYLDYRSGPFTEWKASVLACVNLLLTGTADGTGPGYVGEPIVTDEIGRAIATRRRSLINAYPANARSAPLPNQYLLEVLNAVLNLVADKQESQVLEHLEPEGLLGQALFATRPPPVPRRVNATPRNNNIGNRPLPELPPSGGFYRRYTRKHGKTMRRRKAKRC